MSRPTLVIIPGIGDRTAVYDLFAVAWRLLGFSVHVIPFGWRDYYADLTVKNRDFLSKLKNLGEDSIDIIGVSAGGTAAIMAYDQDNMIRRVIAVCTPFDELPSVKNRLLEDSIIVVQRTLKRFDTKEKSNILSVYGLYDEIVATYMSRYSGIKELRIWSLWHAPSVFVAMTLYALCLKHFLKQG